MKQLFLELYKHIERNNFFSPSSRGKVDKSQTQQGEKVTKIYTLNTPNLFKFFVSIIQRWLYNIHYKRECYRLENRQDSNRLWLLLITFFFDTLLKGCKFWWVAFKVTKKIWKLLQSKRPLLKKQDKIKFLSNGDITKITMDLSSTSINGLKVFQTHANFPI